MTDFMPRTPTAAALPRREKHSPDKGLAGRRSMAESPEGNSPRRGFVGTHPTRRSSTEKGIGKEERLEPARLTASQSGQAG
jgi:hypothetical protein